EELAGAPHAVRVQEADRAEKRQDVRHFADDFAAALHAQRRVIHHVGELLPEIDFRRPNDVNKRVACPCGAPLIFDRNRSRAAVIVDAGEHLGLENPQADRLGPEAGRGRKRIVRQVERRPVKRPDNPLAVGDQRAGSGEGRTRAQALAALAAFAAVAPLAALAALAASNRPRRHLPSSQRRSNGRTLVERGFGRQPDLVRNSAVSRLFSGAGVRPSAPLPRIAVGRSTLYANSAAITNRPLTKWGTSRPECLSSWSGRSGSASGAARTVRRADDGAARSWPCLRSRRIGSVRVSGSRTSCGAREAR